MGIISSEAVKFNNAVPPLDFNNLPLSRYVKRADVWEIRERIPRRKMNSTPLLVPQPDKDTKYFEISGKARYIVEGNAFVGVGGISSVYRAWDRRLGKYVAVKKIQDGMSAYTDNENVIELEAKTMTRINHPGIPEIYDFNIVRTPDGNDTPIMIMQLVEAKDLFTRLYDNSQQELTLDEISNIISQTASTVDFMNKNGLTHGDIKPKNILLSKPHIKIIDFGSSNWVEKKVGAITPGFAPYEVLSNTRDIRSDEFSIAATAYNIFFGDTPPTNSFGDVSNKTIELDIFSPNKFRFKLSQKNKKILLKILIKGLAKNPDDRYQTSSEFAQELSNVLKNP